MDTHATVTSTDEPSFACDLEGRILAWNVGAERLLGHTASDVLGKRCFDVLKGRDLFGNRFCHEHCAIRSMADRHEPVHHWQLSLCSASGERIRASVSVFLLSGARPSEYAIVHLLEGVTDRVSDSNPHKPAETGASLDASLTVRETEVLRMLAGGATTSEIARRLSISDATVRNHTHHILHKLNAHSRLQAVCTATRRHLL